MLPERFNVPKKLNQNFHVYNYAPRSRINTLHHVLMLSVIRPAIRMCEVKYIEKFVIALLIEPISCICFEM